MLGPIWKTKDRQLVRPAQMTTSHIVNTINMIKSGRMARAGRVSCAGFNNSEWVLILQAELIRRHRTGQL